MSTKIKICGIQTIQDVEVMNCELPDYAGFVLAPSKRKIQMNELKRLLSRLDQRIVPVGVFVNENVDVILEAIDFGIKVIQLHGDEDFTFIEQLSAKVDQVTIWKAVRINTEIMIEDKTIKTINNSFIDGVLWDKFSHNHYGGTGETFDWHLVKQIAINKPIILAGGLGGENVEEAIHLLNPFCVDVSSKVETDGKKDPFKVHQFINQVRGILPPKTEK